MPQILLDQIKDVVQWCQSCPVCASRKLLPKKYQGPLQTIVVSKPLQMIAMDILGPLPETKRKNKYVLVIGDYFTKWTEAFPIKNMESTTIAKILVQEFICRYGIPEQIHRDQGCNFEAMLIKEICALLGIQKTRTTPYHPQSDGMIERFNRTLLNMLSAALFDDDKCWDLQLPTIMLAYRTSTQETTGASPFSLMFGHDPQLLIDIEFNLPFDEPYTGREVYRKQPQERLNRAYKVVQQHCLTEQKRPKNIYN